MSNGCIASLRSAGVGHVRQYLRAESPNPLHVVWKTEHRTINSRFVGDLVELFGNPFVRTVNDRHPHKSHVAVFGRAAQTGTHVFSNATLISFEFSAADEICDRTCIGVGHQPFGHFSGLTIGIRRYNLDTRIGANRTSTFCGTRLKALNNFLQLSYARSDEVSIPYFSYKAHSCRRLSGRDDFYAVFWLREARAIL